jgi:hypothetical protein
MKKLISLLLLSIVIAACNPLRHYQEVATDTDVTTKKKKIMAPWIMANFPTEERYVPGDTVIRVDTLTREDTIYWETVDTMQIISPPKVVYRYVTKTLTIRDTFYTTDPKAKAQIFYLTDELNKRDAVIVSQEQTIEDLRIELGLTEDQVQKLWWWLIGIIIAIGAFVFLAIRKKIPFI